MIYTTYEIINRRSIGKGPKLRPAGENAKCDDLWKSAERGPETGGSRA
jgi:hypothetical protein